MATFSVLNGTGINGAGVQFGSFDFGIIQGFGSNGLPTRFSIFLGGGPAAEALFDGIGMSAIFPIPIFSGTATSVSFSHPQFTPIFSISGMNVPLATAAQLFTGDGHQVEALATIFSGNDTIFGSTMNDLLFGFTGDDYVSASNGDDVLFGGEGADTIIGGEGFDFARYDFSTAGVSVNLGTFSGDGGEAEGDIIILVEGLVGSQHADTLVGSGLGNQLWGLGGDDMLFGGSFLVGGDGADQFINFAFDLAQNTFAFIVDFTDGADSIVLSGWNPASVLSFESNGHVFITSSAVGFTGGVAVLNATLAQVQDQIVFV